MGESVMIPRIQLVLLMVCVVGAATISVFFAPTTLFQQYIANLQRSNEPENGDNCRASDYEKLYKYVHKYNYSAPWTRSKRLDEAPPPVCGIGPDFDAFFRLPVGNRSANQEDKVIYQRFFKNMTANNQTGNYLEMGAFDGMRESNSHFFDHCLGWKGLLIEANPRMFPQTRINRPRAHRMSFAPSCMNDEMLIFHANTHTNAGQKGGTTVKHSDYQMAKNISVPCGPLGPVLEFIMEGEPIHFFSLDVEGAEPLILRTIDFTRVKIYVIMAEVFNGHCKADCPSRDATRAIMAEAGYKKIENVVLKSDVYVHPESPFQLT